MNSKINHRASSCIHGLEREESLTGFLLRDELRFTSESSSDLLRKMDGEFKLRKFPRVQGVEKLGNIEKQLMNNTIYPLYKYTSEYNFKTDLIELCDSGRSMQSSRFMKNVFDWKDVLFCPKCFIEQIRNQGFCWLLREWQAPLVTACRIHNVKLCKATCNCSTQTLSNRNFIVGLFSGRCPICSYNTWPDKHYRATQVERKTAEWISNLLKYPPIHLSRAVHLSIGMDMIESKGTIELSDEESLSLFFKGAFKRQRSLDWRSLHSANKNLFKSFKLPVDPVVFYSLVTYSFDSASDFYSHVKECGSVGYLNITLQERQRSGSIEFTNLDEELIQDTKPESISEEWIRLIV